MIRLWTAHLFILSIVFTAYAQGQNYNIDSLKKELVTTNNPTDSLDILYHLVQTMGRSRRYDSLLIYSQQLSVLGESLDSLHHSMIGDRMTGEYYDHSNDRKLAIIYYRRALSKTEDQDKSQKIGTYQRIAAAMIDIGNFNNAIGVLDTAQRLCIQAEDDLALGRIYGQYSHLHLRMNNYKKAIEYSKNKITIIKELNNPRSLFISFYNLATYYEKDKQYKNSLAAYDSAKSITSIYNLPQFKFPIDVGEMQLLFAMDSIETAGKMAVDLYNNTDIKSYPEAGYAIITILGPYYTKVNKPNKAIKVLKEGLGILKDEKNTKIELLLRKHLSEAYKLNGTFDLALEELEIVKTISDSIYNKDQLEVVQEYESKFELEQTEKELLQKELELANSTAQRNILIGSSLFLIGLLSFLYYRKRKNDRLNTSKIENLEKQQKLLALDYMVQGQEEERKRIAQDLHDGLGGLLVGAKLQMHKIQSEIEKFAAINLLSKAEKMIDNAHIEVRRIAHDMMPSALMDLGLIDALEDFASKIQSHTNISVSITDKTDDIVLTDMQKIQLYRIVQEISNNTIKHANADQIKMSFSNTSDHLTLEISDDGSGFDLDEARKKGGMGIMNIESRVKYLNGKLELITSGEGGARYLISVPL